MRKMFIWALAITVVLPFEMMARPEQKSYLTESVPDSWLVDNIAGESTLLPVEGWWHRFDDGVLDTLLEIGVANNSSVKIAARRIGIARASLGKARAAYYPQVDVNGGWTKSKSLGTIHSDHSYWSGGATMSWELDVFGKITEQVRQNKAEVKVSAAEYDAAMISLQAEIATSYFQLRVWQAELRVAMQHAERQLAVVNIAVARYEAKLASMLDVAQAKTVYYSTVASIPTLQTSVATSINSLATLIGCYPERIESMLMQEAELPDYKQLVTAGIPMDLLRRRPDVVEAERNIEALTAALGVARKDWLPTLTLNGSFNIQTDGKGQILRRTGLEYELAPQLTWTMFDGMSRKYNIASVRYQLENAIDTYNLNVMTAIEEVDNALITYKNDLDYIETLNDVVSFSQRAEQLSLDQYKQGLTSFTSVADAQMTYLENVNTLITAKGQALTTLVTLCKALGGGW
jgi:NodT family efflux transporter outer membrane factor (OMF) lipoprotein